MTRSDNTSNETTSNNQQRIIQPIGMESLNLPNCITISRLFLSVFVFWLIWFNGYKGNEGYWLTTAALFVTAAGTDALDGYLARRYGQVTTLGRILDPFADKIIVCGTFIFLLDLKPPDADALKSGVNAWMVVIVIGREMFVTSMRGFLEKHGLDFSANKIGKAKMVLQCMAITGSLLSLSPSVSGVTFNMWRDGFLWAMVLLTVYSGIAYVLRAMQLLRQNATVSQD